MYTKGLGSVTHFVSWDDRAAHSLYRISIPAKADKATKVDAASSHDAVRKAVAFFLDPFWKGPETEGGDGAAGVADWREGNTGAGSQQAVFEIG